MTLYSKTRPFKSCIGDNGDLMQVRVLIPFVCLPLLQTFTRRVRVDLFIWCYGCLQQRKVPRSTVGGACYVDEYTHISVDRSV